MTDLYKDSTIDPDDLKLLMARFEDEGNGRNQHDVIKGLLEASHKIGFNKGYEEGDETGYNEGCEVRYQ